MLFYFCISLILTNVIFFIGFLSLFFSLKSNFFLIIAFEVMFLAINLNFFFMSVYTNIFQGIIFIIFIMVISAIEVVIFLSYFVIFYKKIVILDSINFFDFLKQ